MSHNEDKRYPADEVIEKRGGYASSNAEMTIPTVPAGPAPGESAGKEDD